MFCVTTPDPEGDATPKVSNTKSTSHRTYSVKTLEGSTQSKRRFKLLVIILYGNDRFLRTSDELLGPKVYFSIRFMVPCGSYTLPVRIYTRSITFCLTPRRVKLKRKMILTSDIRQRINVVK